MSLLVLVDGGTPEEGLSLPAQTKAAAATTKGAPACRGHSLPGTIRHWVIGGHRGEANCNKRKLNCHSAGLFVCVFLLNEITTAIMI